MSERGLFRSGRLAQVIRGNDGEEHARRPYPEPVLTVMSGMRADLFDRDATSIIGALGYYVGTITSGIGAWQLKRG